MPTYKIVLLFIPLVVGPLFLALGVWQWRSTKAFVAKAQRATGTYVGNRMETAPTRFGSASSYRQYEFRTPDGRTFGCSSIVGAMPTAPRNKTVEVLYDPHDPQKARINAWVELWGAPAIFLACGLGFLLAAPILLVVVVLYSPS